MRACALVGATDFNDRHFSQQNFDYIVAADAGYAHLSGIGVIPDLVVGDFDSLGYIPEHPHVLSFPSRKDKSDIEIALDEVVTKGFDLMVVYGCLGGRLDFTFALYQLLTRFSRDTPFIYAVGMDSAVCVLEGSARKSICFNESAQGSLSLFSLTPELRDVDEIGLEYTLDKATLRSDEPRGVSNAFCGQASRISVQEGAALLFFSLEAYSAIECCSDTRQ